MKGNVLIIRSLKTNNPWCDKDRAMLYACFQLLVDFLEKEHPERIVDYKHDGEQKKVWSELQVLATYWNVKRPAAEKKIARLSVATAKDDGRRKKLLRTGGYEGKPSNGAYKKLFALEDDFNEREDKMLLRLISIRKQLWC